MNPDVTRLLEILAQTASQAPQLLPNQPQYPPQIPTSDPRLLHGQRLQYQPGSIPTPPTDPKNITDWPTALKYVMNTLGKDEAVMAQIKKVCLSSSEKEGLVIGW